MAPRDPNVQLPRSVRQKVVEGETAFEQVYGQKMNTGGDGDQPSEPPNDEPDEPEDAGPIKPPVGDPPSEQAPRLMENEVHEPRPSPKDDSWEQRFKTLDGRFRAETKRLNEQLKTLDEHNKAQTTAMLEGSNTISRLHRELEEARKTRTTSPPKPVEVELELTPEERDQWSPEFLSVVKRAATAIVNAQMQGKEQEITGLKTELTLLRKQIGDVGGNSEQALHNAFLADMKREVPNFMTVNHSEEFINWLNEPDGYSMEPRKKALDAAVAVRNVAAAVRIFQGYLAELEATSIPPTPPRGNGRVRLDTLAAPRTTRQHPQQTSEAPPPLSPAEIQRFTADVTRGKYKGREQQQADFQKRIDDLARRSIQVAARGNPY